MWKLVACVVFFITLTRLDAIPDINYMENSAPREPQKVFSTNLRLNHVYNSKLFSPHTSLLDFSLRILKLKYIKQ